MKACPTNAINPTFTEAGMAGFWTPTLLMTQGYCEHTCTLCGSVCPTQATFQAPNGIVVMDMHRCIGCRYCMAACPYQARHFNWGRPLLAPEEINPDTHYLGNRPRPRGVVEKCHFCLQRTRVGRQPACQEACQKEGHNAILFGDLNDPESQVAQARAGGEPARDVAAAERELEAAKRDEVVICQVLNEILTNGCGDFV